VPALVLGGVPSTQQLTGRSQSDKAPLRSTIAALTGPVSGALAPLSAAAPCESGKAHFTPTTAALAGAVSGGLSAAIAGHGRAHTGPWASRPAATLCGEGRPFVSAGLGAQALQPLSGAWSPSEASWDLWRREPLRYPPNPSRHTHRIPECTSPPRLSALGALAGAAARTQRAGAGVVSGAESSTCH
jgi:hypothetical protein